MLVGTTVEPTEEPDRGRILGMVQVNSVNGTILRIDEILDRMGTQYSSKGLDENGNYRWPHGFTIYKAVMFDRPPLFKEVFPDQRRVGYAEALNAIELDAMALQTVLAIPHHEVKLPDIPEITEVREQQERMIKLLSSPRIAGRRSGSETEINQPCSVYLMVQPGYGVKVGHSTDLDRRLSDINKYQGLHGYYFELTDHNQFNNTDDAYDCEQLLLRKFSEKFDARGNELFAVRNAKQAEDLFRSVVCDFIVGRT